jgi:hypothetical protein
MRVLFDVADLRKRGFTGFAPVAQPKPALPTESGVYVVAREANDAPHFLAKSDAPTYKGKDPTVPIERLVAEWVDGAQTVTSEPRPRFVIGSGSSADSQRTATRLRAGANEHRLTPAAAWRSRCSGRSLDSRHCKSMRVTDRSS